ncbi:VOC family protein [Vaginisenegalia massiliensis]|uniref:VOC family protein n=1 Tax=Vaginisenegalia massiliensis TaxID=2058294 RepID=UPI000F527CDE|nr:VOC family protein [Vaginisenegalia massiliensis]
MKIDHIGLWVRQLDVMKEFYCHYFMAQANTLYHNPKKSFKSYFLSFEDGTRLELMHKPQLADSPVNQYGYAHLAFNLGSKEAVDQLTQQLKADGYTHLDGPRTTGDGYYEAVVADPEGNLIELTI